jgi:hypothetical protein
MVEFQVWITTPEGGVQSWPAADGMGTHLLGSLDLSDGRRAWVTFLDIPPDESISTQATELKRQWRALPAVRSALLAGRDIRAVLFGFRDADACRWLMDLTLAFKPGSEGDSSAARVSV